MSLESVVNNVLNSWPIGLCVGVSIYSGFKGASGLIRAEDMRERFARDKRFYNRDILPLFGDEPEVLEGFEIYFKGFKKRYRGRFGVNGIVLASTTGRFFLYSGLLL